MRFSNRQVHALFKSPPTAFSQIAGMPDHLPRRGSKNTRWGEIVTAANPPLQYPGFYFCFDTSIQVDGELENLAQSGRHRPQRCRQTDPMAGEAVAHVQAVCLRGVGQRPSRSTLCGFSSSPSTRKDFLYPNLPHETTPARFTGRDGQRVLTHL